MLDLTVYNPGSQSAGCNSSGCYDNWSAGGCLLTLLKQLKKEMFCPRTLIPSISPLMPKEIRNLDSAELRIKGNVQLKGD
jgi:hypothetical protein